MYKYQIVSGKGKDKRVVGQFTERKTAIKWMNIYVLDMGMNVRLERIKHNV